MVQYWVLISCCNLQICEESELLRCPGLPGGALVAIVLPALLTKT